MKFVKIGQKCKYNSFESRLFKIQNKLRILIRAVSYTHLDVYKRQVRTPMKNKITEFIIILSRGYHCEELHAF